VPLVLPQSLPPWVVTDQRCYVAERPVTVSGGGFDPGAPLRITREGVVVGTADAAADGTFATTIASGKLPRGVAERAAELTVSDATTSAVQRFRVTRFGATFAPRVAAPSSFVRFSAFGFGPGHAVYVHYLRPGGGGGERTVRLGATRGDCGSIRRTSARRLFPFRPAAGTWRLQFDTSRAVDPAAVPRVVVPVRVG
jgi:hypothetical protein